MPLEVQRAYRDPIDLRGLLASDVYRDVNRPGVYSDAYRREVLDALARALIARYGDVWIKINAAGQAVSVRMYVSRMENVYDAIQFLRGIDAYGRERGVDAMLAYVMQDRLRSWWSSFEWTWKKDISDWLEIVLRFAGHRQIVWIAAQSARTVIDEVLQTDREACLRAIEAAERWAVSPSEANLKLSADAGQEAYSRGMDALHDAKSWRGEASITNAHAALSTSDVATGAADHGFAESNFINSITDAIYNAVGSDYDMDPMSRFARYAGLARSLLTPTLVTSDSGSVHSTRRR